MAGKVDGRENAASRPVPRLPETVLLKLANDLIPQSSMALALSGECEGFDIVLGRKRKQVISQCFYLAPNSWSRFFRQHVLAPAVTVFDASHTYWFEPQILLDGILQMPNLEDLSINDTKLNLSHLLQIFKVCEKITKLSLSLVEETLDEFQDKPQRVTRSRSHLQTSNGSVMKKAFQKLTHLKIFTCCFNSEYYYNFWFVTLGVLGWCRDCTDLHIEVLYTHYFIMENVWLSGHLDEVLRIAQEEYFPHLDWMTSIKSLVFIKRGYQLNDYIVKSLFNNWIFTRERALDSLQNFWIQENIVASLSSPSFTSLNMEYEDFRDQVDLNHERYRNLQHLGGIRFARMERLPNLKYARGYCYYEEGLSEFCQEHPMLEHLHLDANSEKLRGDWTLLHLKTLVYRSHVPSYEVVDQLTTCCPNITSFHIGNPDGGIGSPDGVDVFFAIRFSHLTTLSFLHINLSDGSFLPTILKHCPKLEIIHISASQFSPREFLDQLGQCIPTAVKLRDLRIEWYHEEDESDVLLFLKRLLKCSSHLERLVLSGTTIIRSTSCDWIPPSQTVAILFEFITKMGHLRALCLAAFRLDPILIEGVKRRVIEEILPVRPSFWLHLGHSLQWEHDLAATAPRLHFDQIVNPIPFFDAPPIF